MKQHNFIVVYITARDSEEAEKIARQLLKRRQAACVNIVPGVSSHFWWQNRLDSAQECLLVAKTKDTLLPDIVKSVRKIHSYGVPEIIALPIVGGSQEYLDWIDSEVT
jgi:periplasmic divalent cation tolerance protein